MKSEVGAGAVENWQVKSAVDGIAGSVWEEPKVVEVVTWVSVVDTEVVV